MYLWELSDGVYQQPFELIQGIPVLEKQQELIENFGRLNHDHVNVD